MDEDAATALVLSLGLDSLRRHHPGLYAELKHSGEVERIRTEIDQAKSLGEKEDS